MRDGDDLAEKTRHMMNSFEKTKQLLDQDDVPNNRLHLAHSSLGSDAAAVGAYQLTLDEPKAAKQWFSIATKQTLLAIKEQRQYVRTHGNETWENEPLKVRDAFYYTLLSQDEKLITMTSDLALEVPEIYLTEYTATRPWYDFIQSLSNYIKNDICMFQEHIEDLVTHIGEFDSLLALRYRGLATALEGIASEDAEQTAEGIADTIPYHETEHSPDSVKSSALICLPAASMRVLALMHGLDPMVNSPYLPSVLDDEYVEVHY